MKHDALLNRFPDSEAQLTGFAHWLATAGLERGLLGPREVDRIWDRHIANCAVVSELIPQGASVIDIGSGAGLPGLAIAIVRPDLKVTLSEPLLRRSDFLNEVVNDLGLQDQVTVRRARAEDMKDIKADVVTARAVAPLKRLLGWAIPLLAPQGQILAMKGSSAATEIEEASSVLKKRTAEIILCGQGIVDPQTTVVRITA